MRLAPLDTDAKLVDLLDEMAHQLKALHTPLGLAFRKTLHAFLAEHSLNLDKDMFAALPHQDK